MESVGSHKRRCDSTLCGSETHHTQLRLIGIMFFHTLCKAKVKKKFETTELHFCGILLSVVFNDFVTFLEKILRSDANIRQDYAICTIQFEINFSQKYYRTGFHSRRILLAKDPYCFRMVAEPAYNFFPLRNTNRNTVNR